MNVWVFAQMRTGLMTRIRLILSDEIVCVVMASEDLTITRHL